MGVDAHAVHFESAQEKEWYYRWFEPDVVVGVGYWGHTPQLVLHPQRYGVQPAPWLVADGYIVMDSMGGHYHFANDGSDILPNSSAGSPVNSPERLLLT